MQVDDQMLALNSTVQLVHGLELSNDGTGVTVHTHSIHMTIIFDGNTAHVKGTENNEKKDEILVR